MTELKTLEELMSWMDEAVEYGWLDREKQVRRDLKGFRREYRIAPPEECLEHHVGLCIEQAWLMHLLLDKMGLPNRLYCCRIFEPDDFIGREDEEYMHCFVLCRKDGKVWHPEHSDRNRRGLYEFPDEETAIRAIEDYYTAFRGGQKSPTTEFFVVEPGLTFAEFNRYINSLDRGKGRT